MLFDGRPTPDAVFDIMRREQPTIFFGAPTGYAAMLAEPKYTRRLRLARACASASRPARRCPSISGSPGRSGSAVDIIDGVGSTEMLHIYLSNRPGDIRYGTSGRAVPGYELRLLDEHGNPVARRRGRRALRAAARPPPRATGTSATRAAARSAARWTRTGDKFVRDADGRYTYCGRADDMFKVSGIWVSPFEVESALISHPAILEAAVIPHADADGLLKPKAFVVLKDASRATAISTPRCAST